MSPWFDVSSGLNFHLLAFVPIIAISSVSKSVGVCCGGVVGCAGGRELGR